MSRLIVKNLPNGITENRLRKIFGEFGSITDVSLKYRTNGNFRKFGFVGYKNESEAQAAAEKLNHTFIDTAKVEVELCKQLGDSQKHRGKLYDESTVTTQTGEKRSHDAATDSYSRDPKRQRIEKLRKIVNNPLLTDDEKTLLKRVIDEPEFEQFLRTHEKAGSDAKNKGLWANDEDVTAVDESTKENAAEPKAAEDLAFLKQKIVKKVAASENRASKTTHCLKLTNLPSSASKSEIKAFLAPHKIVRIFRARKGAGFAYVQLEDDAQVDLAISAKNRNVLKGRQIKLVPVKHAADSQQQIDKLETLVKKQQSLPDDEVETIAESGRLFARNLSYACTEEELQTHFAQCGSVSEVHLPVDRSTRKPKGFALITYLFPENAVTAFNRLDGTIFQGRVLHLLPAKMKTPPVAATNDANKEHSSLSTDQTGSPSKTTDDNDDDDENGKHNNEFKTERDRELKGQAGISHNWNTLFLSGDVVAEAMTKRFNTSKRDIMDGGSGGGGGGGGDDDESGGSSAAVRVALGEAQMVQETKEFLLTHGVNLTAFASSNSTKRSKLVIIAKNFPFSYKLDDVKQLFERFGPLKKFVYPPHGVTALVEYRSPAEARTAFRALAYVKLGDTNRPLYLEWAPGNVFGPLNANSSDAAPKPPPVQAVSARNNAGTSNDAAPDANTSSSSCVFVKSLSFNTNEAALRAHFEKAVGVQIDSVVVAMKRDPKSPAKRLSMGFGFVQLKSVADAQKAVRELQHSLLDNARLELSLSRKELTRSTAQAEDAVLLRQIRRGQTADSAAPVPASTKLCVRNVPFQATQKELYKLFQTMGPVKSVRLPNKSAGAAEGLSSQQHRGFGFVEFASKADAKRCMEAFGDSTHLYGRRLVLEWAQVAEDAAAELDMLREKTTAMAEINRSLGDSKHFKKSALMDSVAKARVKLDRDDAE